ncbi:MAG: sugar phosphate isomerase/epimerase [Actinobacteria bacterium]|nr:sugar phosphate isomerase/epimerase [Actinomycetota bacterium]
MTSKIWYGCSDYTWPKLSHDAALQLIRGMGFEAVDLGLFYGATHVKPERVMKDVPTSADELNRKLEGIGLMAGDVFLTPGSDFTTRAPNDPNKKGIEEAIAMFTAIADFTKRINGKGITVLPGSPIGSQSNEEARTNAVETLKRYVEIAYTYDLEVSFEPHDKSSTPTPMEAIDLVELVPGLKITLDASHFEYAGFDVASYGDIYPHTRHVQVRCASPKVMQAIFVENTIDLTLMIRNLLRSGYSGGLVCEYVWIPTWECRRVDNVSETVVLLEELRGLVSANSH